MYFGKKHIVVGTDRFYKIDLYSYKMSEFLDKHDNTLAFAAFGAAYYDSFPIAVLQLAPPDEHEEYLLCYHGTKNEELFFKRDFVRPRSHFVGPLVPSVSDFG